MVEVAPDLGISYTKALGKDQNHEYKDQRVFLTAKLLTQVITAEKQDA